MNTIDKIRFKVYDPVYAKVADNEIFKGIITKIDYESHNPIEVICIKASRYTPMGAKRKMREEQLRKIEV